MRRMLKSSFLWQFVGGFAIGAVGLVALQPAAARHQAATHFVATAPATR